MRKQQVYILGSGGHSRSLNSLASREFKSAITVGPDGSIGEDEFVSRRELQYPLFNGIGFYLNSLENRIKAYERFKLIGYQFENIVGESAVTKSVLHNEGIQVFEQAYIGPNVSIGNNVVVNTGSIIEHDCILGESSFISPGAIVLGSARIGSSVFVGAGAIIFPGVVISSGEVIPAGSKVTKDL
jgi:carbonic anhydrase/acetyltransferase-like protein (isoleucine patch superfamily)